MIIRTLLLWGLLVSTFAGNASWGSTCIGDTSAQHRLTFEVVPQYPQIKILSSWGPILERIGKASGLCFELFVPKDIPEFETRFSQGRADFVYLNPYHYVVAAKAQKYSALLAEGTYKLSGLVVVKKSESTVSLKNLDGKMVAFPAPNAFGASLLVRAMFADQGIKIDPLYVRTHSNVYRAVIAGDVAAGGGIKATLSAEPPEVQTLLKVIYESDEFSPHPIATKPTVSASIRQAFFEAFVSCAQDMSCKKLLGQIDFVNPVKVSDADYANVEALHIERLQQ